MILAGGRIRTLGRTGLSPLSHLAIAGGKVVACGGREVMSLRGPRTRVVDLEGSAVLPGFNDAHAHVVYYGLTRFAADLSGVRGIDEILDRLKEHARTLKPGDWEHGMGYRTDELTEMRQPHRTELDRVTGERPAFIDERGGHSRVSNTARQAAPGNTHETPNPPGGRIGRDLNRSPNGLLLESAMRLVADVQPAPSLTRRIEGVLKAQDLLVSRGITSVGAAVNRGFADDLRAYERLACDGRLKMRVNEFLSWELLEAAAGLGLRAGFGGSMVRAGPIKVFVDGGAERVAMRSGGGVWRSTTLSTASASWRPCAPTLRPAPMPASRRTSKARSKRASSPTFRCTRGIPWKTTTSSGRCSAHEPSSWAERQFSAGFKPGSTRPSRGRHRARPSASSPAWILCLTRGPVAAGAARRAGWMSMQRVGP